MASLVQGQIVFASIPDPDGSPPKHPRPAAILSRTDTIDPTKPLWVVGITTKFRLPLDDDCYALPWNKHGHPDTGLKRDCVIKSGWVVPIQVRDVQHVLGTMPVETMKKVMDDVRDRIEKKKRKKRT